MQYYLLDCVDCAVLAGRRVDVAAIEVNAIGIYSEVSSRHAVGVENGEDVEDEVISQQLAKFCVSGKLVNDTCHHVRARHFSRMHSRTNHHYFLLTLKLFRLLAVRKQKGIIEVLLPLSKALHRANGQHFHWSSLERVNNGAPVEVDILIDLRALRDVLKKACVVLIGPGKVNGEVVFLVGRKLMRESPLNLIISVDLHRVGVTMVVRLTLCEILFHSLLLASRTTGTSPS